MPTIDPSLLTKRFVRSVAQDDSFSAIDFVKQTATIPYREVSRSLQHASEELRQELSKLVNDEFENFVNLFNDIARAGDGDFQDFQDSIQDLASRASVSRSPPSPRPPSPAML